MNCYPLIVFAIITSYTCAMEKAAEEYVALPPKNVLQKIIE